LSIEAAIRITASFALDTNERWLASAQTLLVTGPMALAHYITVTDPTSFAGPALLALANIIGVLYDRDTDPIAVAGLVAWLAAGAKCAKPAIMAHTLLLTLDGITMQASIGVPRFAKATQVAILTGALLTAGLWC
jgi:hypothetical protein